MKQISLVVLALAAAVSFGADEGAKPAKAPNINAAIKKADANKDGSLSADEIATLDPEVKEKVLALDANKDGTVDAAEIKAAHGNKEKGEKHGKKEKEGGEGAAAPAPAAGGEAAPAAAPAE